MDLGLKDAVIAVTAAAPGSAKAFPAPVLGKARVWSFSAVPLRMCRAS